MVGRTGFEPVTNWLKAKCAYFKFILKINNLKLNFVPLKIIRAPLQAACIGESIYSMGQFSHCINHCILRQLRVVIFPWLDTC